MPSVDTLIDSITGGIDGTYDDVLDGYWGGSGDVITFTPSGEPKNETRFQVVFLRAYGDRRDLDVPR